MWTHLTAAMDPFWLELRGAYMKAEGEYDYVIVGVGTAGCVLANRLTANGKATVLLLEAGGSDNYHWVHIPVDTSTASAIPEQTG